ncbi:kinase-like protein [Calocera cornea HHB12733]|uniref:Kinase-like protein n=1 Tax=Calocera cornea HHB12733 TaxID=1353952 RepID=A0A165G2N1_9BASI|nr:kinase-like protein [Calocera cornea HHB12733]
MDHSKATAPIVDRVCSGAELPQEGETTDLALAFEPGDPSMSRMEGAGITQATQESTNIVNREDSLQPLPAPNLLVVPPPTWRQECLTDRPRSAALDADIDVTPFVDVPRPEFRTGGMFFDVWRGNYHEGGDLSRPIVVALRLFRGRGILENDANRQRLLNEVRQWKTLSHPNILPILGVSRPPWYYIHSQLLLISVWMDNGKIMEYLYAHPDADRLRLLQHIAHGLAYLHEQEPPIVHGDIRGSSVYIDASGRAVLGDYGLLHYIEPTVVMDMRITDYVRWKAPEYLVPPSEVQPRETAAADIYSLGMCFYEITTGEKPFGNERYQVRYLSSILEGRRPEIPEEWQQDERLSKLGEVLVKCWVHAPTSRPTASGVVACLSGISSSSCTV